MKKEQILIRISGADRIGLTASIMAILAQYEAQILDLGQAVIHNTLSLGILIRIDEDHSGQVMKELLFKITELGSISIGFEPIPDDDYEAWAGRQGRNRYILTIIGRSLSAGQIEAATEVIARHGLNIDAIKRLTGRMSIMHPEKNVRACVEFSLRGILPARLPVRRRQKGHAAGPDEHELGGGDRLLLPEGRHVPPHAPPHLLRHGFHPHPGGMH